MSAPNFHTAQHQLNMYVSTVKQEEKMFNARNTAFIKENPLLQSLCVVNPTNENEYWNYATFIEGLDEEGINAQIKMHDFLSQQLRLRLRTKSKAAVDVRESVKTLKGLFKEVVELNRETESLSSI